jgi:hypothetical protein
MRDGPEVALRARHCQPPATAIPASFILRRPYDTNTHAYLVMR